MKNKPQLSPVLLLFCLSLFSTPLFSQILFEESFETVGSWFASNGLWERGAPTGQPTPHSGNALYGTVLNGNYPANANTRLTSPQITLPTVSGEEVLKLKFWHWYSMSSGDNGRLQISIDNGASWVNLSGLFDDVSPAWTQYHADLTKYAGQNIRLGFYFVSDFSGNSISSGWFIDQISIEKAPIIWNGSEGFELGYQDWYASNGQWEVGVPTNGPTPIFGDSLIGTIMNGHYPANANSTLTSPKITLPDVTDGEVLKLKFWHWYSMSSGDRGEFWIFLEDTEEWVLIPGSFDDVSPAWTQYHADLTKYAGQNIRLGFYFVSDFSGNSISSGWFIDQISIEKAPIIWNGSEGFELGYQDWYASNGQWEVGVPTNGPTPIFGDSLIGTIMNGNYPANANSTLTSPKITLPDVADGEVLKLKFWHWYSMSSGDRGEFWIFLEDTEEWVLISGSFDDVSPAWTQYHADLTEYAGQNIRLGFYFVSDFSGNSISSGWFIDQISIEKAPIVCDSLESFENGYQDWYATNGLWEAGAAPESPEPLVGSNLIGTVLGGNYPANANTRLISPKLIVPANALLELKFWHWFSFSSGDQGTVQVSVNNGDWVSVAGPFDGGSGGWTTSILLLQNTVQVGDTIQLGFYFTSDFSGNSVSTGWYLDEIELWCSSNVIGEDCDDGEDNNGNGLIDCADPECTPAINSVVTLDPTEPDFNNGQITINTNFGFQSLESSIDDGQSYQTGNIFSGLSAGNYSIRVRNASSVNCTADYVNNPVILENEDIPCPPINILSVNIEQPFSPDFNNGRIIIAAEGANLEYSIDMGLTYQSSNIFASLTVGSYNVRIRDALEAACTQDFANNPIVLTEASVGCEPPGFAWVAPPDSVCINSPINLCIRQSDVNYTYELLENGFFTGIVIDGNGQNICFPERSISEAATYSVSATQKQDASCTFIFTNSNHFIAIGTLGFTYTAKDESTFGNDGRIDICINTGTPPYALTYLPTRGTSLEVPSPCLGNIELDGLRAGYYRVYIEDAEGCSSLKTIPVNNPNKIRIGFPEKPIITPNGDGLNDRLVFEGLLISSGEAELIIFTRHGSVIYEGPAEPYDDLWDATWNGELVPAGVYYYSLKVNIPDETVLNGFITVIR